MAAIVYFCARGHVPALQQKIQNNAQSALDASATPNVNVSVDGRTATLSGAIASEEVRTSLVDSVANAEGVRTVNDELTITGIATASTEDNEVIQTPEVSETEAAEEPTSEAEGVETDEAPPEISPEEAEIARQLEEELQKELDEAVADSDAELPEPTPEPNIEELSQEPEVEQPNDVPNEAASISSDSQSVADKAQALIEQARLNNSSDSGISPSFAMKLSDGALRLSGDISNRDSVIDFIKSAMTSLDASYVLNNVQMHENRNAATWLPDLTEFMPNMRGIDEAQIDIIETQITISGFAKDEQTHDALIDAALASLPDLSLVERIGIAEPSAEPPAPEAQITSTDNTAVAQEQRLTLREAIDALGTDNILFESGSDVLTNESLQSLGQIAEQIAQYPNIEVEINGHTDSSGNSANNLQLSQNRANAVRDFLVQQGIEPSRLLAYGFGDGVPIADNSTSAGRKLNRRIEFNF